MRLSEENVLRVIKTADTSGISIKGILKVMGVSGKKKAEFAKLFVD